MLMTDGGEYALMDVRVIEFDPQPDWESELDTGDAGEIDGTAPEAEPSHG
jgi:hypothetical protein